MRDKYGVKPQDIGEDKSRDKRAAEDETVPLIDTDISQAFRSEHDKQCRDNGEQT